MRVSMSLRGRLLLAALTAVAAASLVAVYLSAREIDAGAIRTSADGGVGHLPPHAEVVLVVSAISAVLSLVSVAVLLTRRLRQPCGVTMAAIIRARTLLSSSPGVPEQRSE